MRLRSLINPAAAPVILEGHTDGVISVSFGPDGQRQASRSWDDTVWLWDLANPSASPSIPIGHGANVLGVAFSPDEWTPATGSSGGTIRHWIVYTRDAE